MPTEPVFLIFAAFDIEKFGRKDWDDQVRVKLRHGLQDVLTKALVDTEISEEAWSLTMIGDGLLAMFQPSAARTGRVVRALIEQLPLRLDEHNRQLAPGDQLRVRGVVHAGHALLDGEDVVGDEVNLAFRLLDSNALRRRLQRVTGSLVVAVTEDVHRQVVSQRHFGLSPAWFSAEEIAVKETRTRMWVCPPVTASGPVQADESVNAPHDDVVLSYRSQDTDSVEGLASRLEKEYGITVRRDRWARICGSWRQELAWDPAMCGPCAICIGSQASNEWIAQIMGLSTRLQERDGPSGVIGVVLPGCPGEVAVQDVFQISLLRDLADFRWDPEQALDTLVKVIREKPLGGEPSPGVQRQAPTVAQIVQRIREWDELKRAGGLHENIILEVEREILAPWRKRWRS